VSGTVTNGGTLFASGAGSLVDILGVVNGGVLEIGDGIVAIAKPGSEAVVFTSGGTGGGLELDDHAGDPLDFKSRISGFGGSSHANTTQFIDLVTVTSGASMGVNYVSAAGNTSGTLIVTSGAMIVAEITLVGTYVTSNFHLGTGTGRSVKITDPAMPSDGGVVANVALFGNYIAGSFAANGPGAPIAPGTLQPMDQILPLAAPHRG
jgi:hypothetical protein